VAAEETNTEALIEQINTLQKKMAVAGAVDDNVLGKGVVVDKDSGDKVKAVNPNLTSSEETRYEKIFKILKEVISPGPEAGRSAAASRLDKEAQVAGIGGPGSLIKASKEKTASLLAALPLLYQILKDNLATAFGALGSFLKTTFKKVFEGFGKRLISIFKGIGSFISKQFVRAGGFIKGVFTGLMKSPAGVRLSGAIAGAFASLRTQFSSLKSAFSSQASRFAKFLGIGGSTATIAQQAAHAGSKGSGGAIMKETGKRVFGAAATSAVLAGTATAATNSGKRGQQSLLSRAIGGVGTAFNTVTKGPIELAKKFIGPNLMKLGKGIVKRLPIVSTIIEAPFAAYDIKKYSQDPELGEEQIRAAIGNRVVQGIGGVMAGSTAAALALLIPGVGPFLSAIAYMGGDFLGRFLADRFTENVPMTALGGMVMDAFPNFTASARKQQAAKLDDGIIYHGGQTVRINSKDDVLALKKGGPLDRMMRPNSMDIGSAQIFGDMKEFSRLQLETLIDIKNGIVALVQQSNNSLAGISSSSSKVNFTTNKVTSDFNRTLTA